MHPALSFFGKLHGHGDFVSGGRTRIPPWSAEMASSRGEHSMPFEISPAMFFRPSSTSSRGTRAPGLAHGTTSPGRKFPTPATTWCVPEPSSTFAIHSGLFEDG